MPFLTPQQPRHGDVVTAVRPQTRQCVVQQSVQGAHPSMSRIQPQLDTAKRVSLPQEAERNNLAV